MACNLITFYDKKTEHREIKRKQKKIYQKRLSINAHCFQVNRVLSLTLPNIILQKDLIWKGQYKFVSYKNNVFVKISMKIKKILDN